MRSAFGAGQQAGQRQVEGVCEADQQAGGGTGFAALDLADRAPRNAGPFRQIGQRPAPRVALQLEPFSQPRLDRVLGQLRLYEHPVLNFSARAKGEAVEVIITFKDESIPVHTYYFDLHPRDLDDPQFEWSFQRQLFDALHDYFVEMFIRTPQDRADRQRKGL